MAARHLLSSPGAAEPPGEPSPGTSLAVGALGGIIVGAVAAAVLAFAFMWWLQRRLRSDSPDDEQFLEALAGLPPRFSYKALLQATKDFKLRLGSGGSGSVYEGRLPSGARIAVKKLSSQLGSLDFRAEVATLGGIHHFNLVRLLGFCAQGPHRLLVYEFMPNGSLDRWIFGKQQQQEEEKQDEKKQEEKEKSLNWSRRFAVAVGTARGLAYLHDDCAKRIVHFDIKPQNILLDENFVPKVSDFGLSKISEKDMKAEAITTVRGTPGYVAPEWILGANITEKGDVYSYGLVLFELMGGRRNLEAGTYFPALVLQHVRERGYGAESLGALLDRRVVEGGFDPEQAGRMMRVAMWCMQEGPEERPNMRDVVLMLEGTLAIPDPPTVRFAGLLPLHHPTVLSSEERSRLERQAFGGDSSSAVGLLR